MLLDTSFISWRERLRRRGDGPTDGSAAEKLARVERAIQAVTPFTIAELRAGALIANWGERRWADTERALAAYLQIPLDPLVVEEWARLRAFARTSGHDGISHNDLWNAATASSRGIPLAVVDRDFSRIAGALSCALIQLAPDP